MPVSKNCIICKKQFFVRPFLKNIRFCCSNKCRAISLVKPENAKCRFCKKPFRLSRVAYQQGEKNCSWECRIKGNAERREKKAEKNMSIMKACQVCQKEFYVRPSRANCYFCSNKCRADSMRGPTNAVCENCGKAFHADYAAKHCSWNCRVGRKPSRKIVSEHRQIVFYPG